MDDPIPPPIFISSIPDEANLSIALNILLLIMYL